MPRINNLATARAKLRQNIPFEALTPAEQAALRAAESSNNTNIRSTRHKWRIFLSQVALAEQAGRSPSEIATYLNCTLNKIRIAKTRYKDIYADEVEKAFLVTQNNLRRHFLEGQVELLANAFPKATKTLTAILDSDTASDSVRSRTAIATAKMVLEQQRAAAQHAPLSEDFWSDVDEIKGEPHALAAKGREEAYEESEHAFEEAEVVEEGECDPEGFW